MHTSLREHYRVSSKENQIQKIQYFAKRALACTKRRETKPNNQDFAKRALASTKREET